MLIWILQPSTTSDSDTDLDKIFLKLLESLGCSQNSRTGLHISLMVSLASSDLGVDEDEVNFPDAVIEVCGDVLLALLDWDGERLHRLCWVDGLDRN